MTIGPDVATTHSFTLILGSDTQFTDDVAERICLEVGDDTLFGTCNGVAHIDFEREGESFRDVVLSAIADVERIGLRVERVETDCEVDEEIAAWNAASDEVTFEEPA